MLRERIHLVVVDLELVTTLFGTFLQHFLCFASSVGVTFGVHFGQLQQTTSERSSIDEIL